MGVLVLVRGHEEIAAVADGLDEHERSVKHQGHCSREHELRGAELRADSGGGKIRQHEGEHGQGREYGQGGTRTLNLKALFVVPHAACQQAQPDDAVADDHHCGEHRVARQSGGVALAAEHDGHDQRHLDDRHGQGEDQGAEGFSDTVRNGLGMVHRREHGRDQGRAGHGGQDSVHGCDGCDDQE